MAYPKILLCFTVCLTVGSFIVLQKERAVISSSIGIMSFYCFYVEVIVIVGLWWIKKKTLLLISEFLWTLSVTSWMLLNLHHTSSYISLIVQTILWLSLQQQWSTMTCYKIMSQASCISINPLNWNQTFPGQNNSLSEQSS